MALARRLLALGELELNETGDTLNRNVYYVVEDEAVNNWTPTMLVLCYVLGGLLIMLLALYVTLELHYFLRMCLCVLMARFCKPRISILDDTYVHGERVHHHRRGHAPLPHEQRALPAGAGLRARGLLRAHGAVPEDPAEGRRRGAGRVHHPLPALCQALLHLQDHVQDHLLGRQVGVHGAPLHHAQGRLRAGNRAVPAAGDPVQRRGRDGGAAGARGRGAEAAAAAGGGQVDREQRDLQRQPAQRLLTPAQGRRRVGLPRGRRQRRRARRRRLRRPRRRRRRGA